MNYVYKIVKDNTIIYVGFSTNLELRVKSHKRRFGENVKLIIIYTSINRENALIMEEYYIKKYQPKYNIIYKCSNLYIDKYMNSICFINNKKINDNENNYIIVI
jgi:excinuclease ABC subunit C